MNERKSPIEEGMKRTKLKFSRSSSYMFFNVTVYLLSSERHCFKISQYIYYTFLPLTDLTEYVLFTISEAGSLCMSCNFQVIWHFVRWIKKLVF